ncbi:MAG: hypothetical protein B6D39_01120 [Anaerolineae bacterium UTCFX2]|jgi:mutator protein MutT|nr:MAG: hypothetical protein B6D39_01120 [Anaerolineae bacterium UTCFX2]
MSAMLNNEVNFCLRCGAPLSLKKSFGAVRPTCPDCGWVYFADPKVAVAAIIEQDQQVLLARRANDPYRGLWTLPAGFVDAGEDPRDTVVRECREETGLEVSVTDLVDVIAGQEHPRGAHILIVFRVNVLSGELRAGDDADQLGFFRLQDLPPLAFKSTRQILGLP